MPNRLMGFEEHPAENVRLESNERPSWYTFYCENNNLAPCPSERQLENDVRLHGSNYHRVAKNPLQFASIQALIFHALRTRHTPGKKVMFCARELTAHFPTAAAATPYCKRSQGVKFISPWFWKDSNLPHFYSKNRKHWKIKHLVKSMGKT